MMAGSWMNLKNLVGTDLELAQAESLEGVKGDKAWKISSDGLAKRLKETTLMLVDDGAKLKMG